MHRNRLYLLGMLFACTNPLAAQPLAMREIADLSAVTPTVDKVALSPNGRYLAITAQLGGDVLLMDLQSGSTRAMGLGRPYQMRWSPASDQITFTATDEGGLLGVYTAGIGEGAPIRRVAGEANLWTPIYSPRGDSIAFVSSRGCTDEWYRCFRLVAAPARGGEVREIGSHVGYPIDWSRDGNWIYYGLGGSRRSGTYHRMPASGGEPIQIATSGEHPTGPDLGLSSDNRFFGISLAPPAEGGVHTIVIYTADGRELLRRDLPPDVLPQRWTAGNDVIGLHRGERKVFEIEVSSLLP